MISVLREVAQNMVQGRIRTQDFKIIYVAPMKALAAEVTSAFARRLAPLGKPVGPQCYCKGLFVVGIIKAWV